jgi:ribosome-binding protein aMBF1 (putative translation factor)
VYTNETQSPWPLSHPDSTMLRVKAASSTPRRPKAASSSARSPRSKHVADNASTNPLFLQQLFGSNVRLVRTAKGLSQEDLADRASVDRTYVSSIERRLRNVSIQNVQRLALALDVDPRDLLSPSLADDPRFRDRLR